MRTAGLDGVMVTVLGRGCAADVAGRLGRCCEVAMGLLVEVVTV